MGGERTGLPADRATRVLFVDDDLAILGIAEEILPHFGYQICIQPSGEEALKGFRSNPDAVDIVVTDQFMPGMTGDMLAMEFLQVKPDLPILLCTGAHDQTFLAHIRSIGIRGYLVKPYLFTELDEHIRQVVGSRTP